MEKIKQLDENQEDDDRDRGNDIWISLKLGKRKESES